ncbi:hypothetical protein EVAR_16506_1 [Eumeta japonica]|uniref:Uncharacterized protein n=1 Tax=Eumeta variegata TaxID=151549 RepID=A0A4C1U3K0_EUMVA|nr:hypothetical protein EVAR_16506_1 [Eumeta japonica]
MSAARRLGDDETPSRTRRLRGVEPPRMTVLRGGAAGGMTLGRGERGWRPADRHVSLMITPLLISSRGGDKLQRFIYA